VCYNKSVVLIFSLIASHATIDIPAGYYTLPELAAALKPVAEIKVDPAAAPDMYAVRFAGKGWEDIRAALIQDGRLKISQENDVWIIRRNRERMDAEAKNRAKYLEQIRGTLNGIYSQAATQTGYLMSLPEDDRSAALKKIPYVEGVTPATAVSRLIHASIDYEAVPFSTLGLTAFLTDPKRPSPFSSLQKFSLFDCRGAIYPGGDLSQLNTPFVKFGEMSEPEREDLARRSPCLAKISLDPISLTTSFRWLMRIAVKEDMIASMQMLGMTPQHFVMTIKPADVFDQAELDAARDRGASSDTLGEQVSQLADQPRRPIRASEALLRASDASKSDLVCYVSPFADWELTAAAKRSIQSVLKDTTSERFDSGRLYRACRERTSYGIAGKQGLGFELDRKLTLSCVGGIYVVRNEYRFLDGLSSSPTLPATKFANTVFLNHETALQELAKTVADEKIGSWKSSLFANSYLDFCNPITFRPIAIALVRSKKLQEAMKGMKTGLPMTFNFSDLEAPAREAVLSAMEEESSFNDATADLMQDPIFSATGYRKVADQWQIEALQEGTQISFRIAASGINYWTTWAQHIQNVP
jgi:hypothetical protein